MGGREGGKGGATQRMDWSGLVWVLRVQPSPLSRGRSRSLGGGGTEKEVSLEKACALQLEWARWSRPGSDRGVRKATSMHDRTWEKRKHDSWSGGDAVNGWRAMGRAVLKCPGLGKQPTWKVYFVVGLGVASQSVRLFVITL